MPNWVRNNLTITRVDGKSFNTNDINDKLKVGDSDVLKLSTIVPEPEYGTFDEEVPGDEYKLSPQRHSWRFSNWGTKWDSDMGELMKDVVVDEFFLSFDTAWNSPVSVLITLSEILGEDYKLRLEASDEFLGNLCDYNLEINDGDVVEIPIEGDYEEWWNNVWGYEPYDIELDS